MFQLQHPEYSLISNFTCKLLQSTPQRRIRTAKFLSSNVFEVSSRQSEISQISAPKLDSGSNRNAFTSLWLTTGPLNVVSAGNVSKTALFWHSILKLKETNWQALGFQIIPVKLRENLKQGQQRRVKFRVLAQSTPPFERPTHSRPCCLKLPRIVRAS